MDRQQLADFLRTRRAAIQPGDVGLPSGTRRRTPGLRRQEVAQLAGISVEYYIRLEQARGPKPSRQVLQALSRALVLDRDQRSHLFHLVEQPPQFEQSREVTPTIRNLLDGLNDFPAYAIDAAYDIIAWNEMSERLMGYLGKLTPEQRNILRTNFSGPDTALRLANPATREFLRYCVSDLRASLACTPSDPKLRGLVDELLRTSPEFGEMWADHEVAVRRVQTKRVVHESLGPLEFDCQVLEVPGSGLRLIFYVPQPGSPTEAAFKSLASVTSETPASHA